MMSYMKDSAPLNNWPLSTVAFIAGSAIAFLAGLWLGLSTYAVVSEVGYTGKDFVQYWSALELLAPFGWFFDQTVLLVMYLSTVYFSLSSKNWLVILSLMLLQVFAYFYISNVARFQHEMFWYLPVLCFFWGIVYRAGSNQERFP